MSSGSTTRSVTVMSLSGRSPSGSSIVPPLPGAVGPRSAPPRAPTPGRGRRLVDIDEWPRRRPVPAPPPTYDREVRNAPPVRAAPPVPSNEVCELIDREVLPAVGELAARTAA